MTDPDSPTASLAPATREPARPETLESQLQSLRLLFVATLMALLVLSVGVDFYLWYQVKLVRHELNATYAFLSDYQKTKEPLLTRLIAGLQTFAQSHPDITPLLDKYNIRPSATNLAEQPAPATTAATP
jgi:hypothetical protein